MAIKTKKVLPKTHGTNNTITSTINTTGGGSIQLPTTGNNGTGGLYGQFTPTMGNTGGISIVGSNNAPTAPVGVGSLQPITIGGNGAGGAYGDFLTPTLPTTPTNPVYTPIIGGGNSLVGGGSAIGGNLVKPVDPSQYFDGGVVGTVGGGFSGGNKGGVTDEGVITGRLPNADDVTVDNNGFKGTGATFVPPASGGSGSVSNGGTTTGTGAGAGTGTSDSTPTTPTDTKPETGETSTMTYEQYIAEQKAREEEKRQAALKEAEIYKERAAADAQASYMQNMSTYGVNAETMTQMGLTGGGYSDYLNAQAYAQKRGDLQAADRNELALKQQAETTYGDNIAALNKELFTYQETQKTNKQTGYNTLLGYAMDANSGMTEETIRAMAKNIGLSEEEIQQAVDIWNGTKKGAEVSLDGEEDTSQYGAQAFISAIQNGEYKGTREELYETCLQNRNAGYMTQGEIEQVMKEYDTRVAKDKGEISTDTYYNATNGDENAKKVVETVMNAEQLEANAKEKAKTEYGLEYPGKIINVTKDNLNIKDFGSYSGTGKNGKQDTYIKKIVEDARAGKIQAGQVIIANYGWQSSAGNMGYFMYIGNGIFVAVSATDNPGLRSLYIPDGYGKDFFGNIKKK